jgi:hypothetical protein
MTDQCEDHNTQVLNVCKRERVTTPAARAPKGRTPPAGMAAPAGRAGESRAEARPAEART